MLGSGFNLQLGTVGEWFAGIGGFLAVFVAFYFGHLEHKRGNEQERSSREAEQRERYLLRQQAASLIRIYRDESFCPTVESRSSLPFLDISIVGTHPEPYSSLEVEYVDALPPGQSRRSDSLMVRESDAWPDGDPPSDGWRVPATLEIYYTDVDGLQWRQDEVGRIWEKHQ